MKKLLSAFVIFLFCITGCNKSDPELSGSGMASPSLDAVHSVRKSARYDVGIKSLGYYIDRINKRYPDRAVDSIIPLVKEADTLLYVVNYKNAKGWHIISGDKRTDAILSYSDSGRFDPAGDNPGIRAWMTSLSDRIADIKKGISTGDTASFSCRLWDCIDYLLGDTAKTVSAWLPDTKGMPPSEDGYWNLEDVEVEAYPSAVTGPLTRTKWHQSYPWNQCVPLAGTFRCPAGCTSVAGAQMMYYIHEKLGIPSNMYEWGECTGRYDENYTFSFGVYLPSAWGKMAVNEYDTDGVEYSSVLIGFVGYSIKTEYGPDGSAALPSRLAAFLNGYGISCNLVNYNAATVQNSIVNDRMPVIINGYPANGGTGHTWIMDGIETTRERVLVRYVWRILNAEYEDLNPPTRIVEHINSKGHYAMMNWGWPGDYSGARYKMDGSDWNGYTTEITMIHGFKVK